MMTVNPSNISPTLLQQLALHDANHESSGSTAQNVPVPTIAQQRVQVPHQHIQKEESSRDRDIKMQTANRGYLPPSSHAQAQRQQAYLPHQQQQQHTQVPTQPVQQYQQQTQQQQSQAQQVGPPALSSWEKQILNDPDVKRKATLAQLCKSWRYTLPPAVCVTPGLTVCSAFLNRFLGLLL